MRWIPMLLALSACGSPAPEEAEDNVVDSDGDGLSDAEEAEFGSDPERTDSDDDFLGDAEERERGTDPTNPDTDGDGYLDGDEVQEDKDPTDPVSRIYVGGWPYNRDKTTMDDPGITGKDLKVGDFIWNHIGGDQHDERVELYDFGKQDKLTIIDSSAVWCTPCNDVAEWLATGNDDYFERYYPDIRELVNTGKLQWVTVLAENRAGDPTDSGDSAKWDSWYPNERIPVLSDRDYAFYDAVNSPPGYAYVYPQLVLVTPQMRVISIGSYTDVFVAAREAYANDNAP